MFKKIKSWDSCKEHLYIQSIDNGQFNKILAILENFNLDNATEDASNEIVENRNKIYIDSVKISMDFRKKMTKKSKHQTNIMLISPNKCMPLNIVTIKIIFSKK